MVALAVKLALGPVLVAQAVLARRRMPELPEAPGPREGCVGDPAAGARLRLLVVGDSSAAGVGVDHQQRALAAPLAQRVSALCGVPVQWALLAQSGLTTRQADEHLQRHSVGPWDVAVVVTGVNDIIDQVPSHHAVAARDALANRLRNAHGVRHVAYAPLPPVHRFPGLPQPLRWVAGADARRHNDALTRWVATRSDVSKVPMQPLLDPSAMAADGFHPGEPVYRYCATAIATHLAAAVWPLLQNEEVRR